MTTAVLRTASETFATLLNNIVDCAVDAAAGFVTEISPRGGQAQIEFVGKDRGRLPDGALIRSCDSRDRPALFLRAKYTVEMDPDGSYLRVVSSSLGLWVDVTEGQRPPRPVVRVEFDRRRLQPGRAAAHVHLHANSPELAWIYGSSSQPAPHLHSLHFPAGGRRFRPTLEEFLLFLDREGLFNDWKEGWKPKLIQSLEAWERMQARATARQFPEEAVGALEALGYGVTAPTGDTPG